MTPSLGSRHAGRCPTVLPSRSRIENGNPKSSKIDLGSQARCQLMSPRLATSQRVVDGPPAGSVGGKRNLFRRHTAGATSPAQGPKRTPSFNLYVLLLIPISAWSAVRSRDCGWVRRWAASEGDGSTRNVQADDGTRRDDGAGQSAFRESAPAPSGWATTTRQDGTATRNPGAGCHLAGG